MRDYLEIRSGRSFAATVGMECQNTIESVSNNLPLDMLLGKGKQNEK